MIFVRRVLPFLLLGILVAMARLDSIPGAAIPGGGTWSMESGLIPEGKRPYRAFPSLYFRSRYAKLPDTVSEHLSPGHPQPEIAERQPILAGNTILAFYGNPLSTKMGILGVYAKEKIVEMLQDFSKAYDQANGAAGVIPAFYIVYGTCWPKGDIGYIGNEKMLEYILYAAERGIQVFIDHQIGKYSVKESMERILPFLEWPNVHLALDPEWRTVNPMKEIGSITAAELNSAQIQMQTYMEENNIPGIRMLVVHQFKDSMIKNAGDVRADLDRVLLVHTADGFGAPAFKRHMYAANARFSSMPLKGFKLFFKSDVPSAGFDEPLLSPSEVMAFDPEPVLVMYQ